MTFVRKVIDFFLFGNIFIAFCAAALVQSTALQLDIKNQLVQYTLLTFFATLFLYNLQRIFYTSHTKDTSLNSIRRKWIFENQLTIKSLSTIGFMGASAIFIYYFKHLFIYLLPLLLLSLGYFFPMVKLRKNGWFKLITLVFVWTMITAVMPIVLNDGYLFSFKSMTHITARFFFMVGICLPFDIRDIRIDSKENISTLPQVLGEKKTRLIAFAFMLLYILLIMVEYSFGVFNIEITVALLTASVINTTLVLMSNSNRNEYFYSAGLDGTMLVQWLLLIIFVNYM